VVELGIRAGLNQSEIGGPSIVKKLPAQEGALRLFSSKTFFKIFSVFSAVSLWFYVLNSEPLEVIQELPIEFVTPVDQAIANVVESTVKVKLKGSRAFMQNLFRSDETFVIDLRDPSYQNRREFEVSLNTNMVQVPFGVEVLDVSPSQMTIMLERKITKEVPIRVQFQGELGPDLRLITQELEPNRVMISGPVELMRRTTSLRTTPVPLTSLEGEGELRLHFFELDPRIQVENEANLSFRYSVKAQTANLTLKNVRVRFLASRQDFSARQRDVSIDVLAPEGRVLRESEVQVVADIPEDARGNINIKLRAILPEGVHLLQIHPETISIRVR
jgi:YbbR domain-containing protein